MNVTVKSNETVI